MAGDGAAWLGKGYTREARWPARNLDIDLRYSGKSLRPFARKPLARLSNTADGQDDLGVGHRESVVARRPGKELPTHVRRNNGLK